MNAADTSVFSRNFILISLINLLLMMPHYLLFVVIGPYAKESFGASASMSGLAAGILVIGVLIGRFVVGGYLQAIGYKKSLLLGTAFFSLSLCLYVTSNSMPTLLAVRLVNGVFIGCAGTATNTIVAETIPARLRGQGIGYFTMSSVMGMAIGPFLGISLMGHLSFIDMFWMCVGLGALSFVVALFVSAPPTHHAVADGMASAGLARYIEKKAVPISITILLAGVGYSGVQAFITLHARELDLVEPAALYFLLYAAVAFCARPVSGRIFDTFGAGYIVYPAILAMGASLFVISFTTTGAGMLASAALLGMGFGTYQSVAQTISVDVAPPGRFGQSTSTYFIFLDFGVGFGPYLLGFIVPMTGYSGVFAVSGVLTLLLLPLYRVLHGRDSCRGAAVR